MNLPTSFGENDSLFGHVLKDHRPIAVGEVPDGYISFGSGLGQHKPRYLALAPASSKAISEASLNSVSCRLSAMTPCRFSKKHRKSLPSRSGLQSSEQDCRHCWKKLNASRKNCRSKARSYAFQTRSWKNKDAHFANNRRGWNSSRRNLNRPIPSSKNRQRNWSSSETTWSVRKTRLRPKLRKSNLRVAIKSDFLANMSHELRTPLNSSLILAKLLADNSEGNLTAQQVQFAQTIQSSGNDLLNLINDILDLSKIEAGHVEIHPEAVSIERTLSGLRHMFEPLASNKGLQFKASVEAGVPAVIQTDPQRLEQILKNLLANALKFTESGSVSLDVRPYG